MYNAWCDSCKKMVQVETEYNPKCPKCKKKVEIKGKKLKISTSNGPYATHF